MTNETYEGKKQRRMIFSAILFFFFLWYIGPIGKGVGKFFLVLKPFFVGLMMAFLINLLMNYFERVLFSRVKKDKKIYKRKAGLSLTLSRLVVLAGTSILLNVLIPRVIDSVNTMVYKRPNFVHDLGIYMKDNPLLSPYEKNVTGYLRNFNRSKASKLISRFTKEGSLSITKNLVTSIGSNLMVQFLGFIFSIYFLLSKKAIRRRRTRILYATFSEKTGDRVNYICSLSYDTFAKYVKSRVLDAIILGAMAFVGMIGFKIPYPGMISILIGVTDVIPYFGPIIGTLVSLVLVFVESPIKSLILMIYILVIQQIQEKIIYPAIIGKQMGLPAILSLVSVTLGGSLFGILGMLTFMPIFSILYTLVNEGVDKSLAKKSISFEGKANET